MRYIVVATVTRVDDYGHTRTSAVPAFFLHSAIQGIVDAEHARQVATEVINPCRLPGLTVNATVYESPE